MGKQADKLYAALRILLHDSVTASGHVKTPSPEAIRDASKSVSKYEKHLKNHESLKTRKFKKGDIVRVWSLQSWSYGGFLNGKKGEVRQDQHGNSVLVCLERNFNGEYKMDNSYEVYAKQCKLVKMVEDKKKS